MFFPGCFTCVFLHIMNRYMKHFKWKNHATYQALLYCACSRQHSRHNIQGLSLVGRGPLGNIPLFGMGFYWCKMCVRHYASIQWPSRLASKLHCTAALPSAQARPLLLLLLLLLSSSRSQIKAYQMQEEKGEMQFCNERPSSAFALQHSLSLQAL